jgi:hypothetical protein
MHTTPRRSLRAFVTLTISLVACRDDPLRPPLARNAPSAATSSEVAGPDAPSPGLIRWNELSDPDLWAQIQRAGDFAEVGLKLPGHKHGMSNGRVLLSRTERHSARSAVAAVAGVSVETADTLLPIARVKLKSLAALAELRKLPNVSFVEPGAFVDIARESHWLSMESGCSIAGYGGPGGSTTIFPGDVLPWNYSLMNIPAAWTRAPGGFGVTVGIVDTGLDYGQWELNGEFSSGMSTGRTFTKAATSYAKWPVVWQDDCGHGTRMASVIAGPRNGQSILGVAWGANLYSVRVDDDVFLSNVAATRLGIRAAAAQAKIIATAFGTIAFYQSISDELSYWYAQDKLFIAAAGTSFCFGPQRSSVMFPGSEPTVTTVTGLDPSGAISCESHYGPAVDFAAYTNQPATGLSLLGSTLAGFGGSSDAVGVISGIAALALSLHPTYSRDQILTDLAYAASPTGLRGNQSGWGPPNALCVVGGVCTAWIKGPDLIQSIGTKTYSWTAGQAAAPPGNISYQWSTGEVTPTISRKLTVSQGMQEYTLTLSVTVTDNTDGSTRTITKYVLLRDPYNCPTCW